MKVTVRVGGATRTFALVRRGDRLTVTPDGGESVEVRLVGDGEGGFELERGPARIRAAGMARGGARQLWVDGHTFAYTRDEGRASREPVEDLGLASTIPAVVLEVLVAPGQRVAVGQKLLLLESMKMVMPVQASRAGVVRAILCAEGQAVLPGVPLVEIDDVEE